MKKRTLVSALLAGMLLSPLASAGDLDSALNNELRTPANAERDDSRHPKQTLHFFGVKPNHTVIELWPGGRWYAEILAPYLAKEGHYIGANFDANPPKDVKSPGYKIRLGKALEEWITTNKTQLGHASSFPFEPPRLSSLGEDNSADVVLTFRNLHNWAMQDQLQTVFDSAYSVLKPGGIFGVVEHRSNPGMDPKSGYMSQEQTIEMARKAGFDLVASSEINANPKDTKDYPKGVWTLPPRLAMGDQDKQKYVAIGESDRMTLKFIKK
ncbi:class I SAM-dependent methyltransferase [Shewanella sp. Scap07]|uniref:class I SAM-dependent methyltransferase n=1 Tax=Shewanella sp. Scap07 TaxID=2589987 RepID=UPI0015C1A659|nr:methyltransferase domain-containing protein [Shewanella sp. Scap07]QLE85784.1 class I SAM-dependent methyltransferase [Shewanella sp. Scap07]